MTTYVELEEKRRTERRIRELEGRVVSGTGSPESSLVAPVGTLYLRQDGGTSTTLYVKESGTGNTGWVAK